MIEYEYYTNFECTETKITVKIGFEPVEARPDINEQKSNALPM